MDIDGVLADIKSLEQQLAVLKAEIKPLSPGDQPKTFADLYGVWASRLETTEEDMKSVKYRFDWEGEEFGGTPQ
jgi:hypothetical protein